MRAVGDHVTAAMAAAAVVVVVGSGCREKPTSRVLSSEQKEAARQADLDPVIEVALGGDIRMKMVLVPPGTFTMGSPPGEPGRGDDETQHEVSIPRPFYLAVHEVTQRQFARFVRQTGYVTRAERDGWSYAWDGKTWGRRAKARWRTPGFPQRGADPVVCVSWNDAVAFCEWLSGKAGAEVRLPTEAEWEYACRAGTTSAYFWGDDPDSGGACCNGAGRDEGAVAAGTTFAWQDGHRHTAPVGSFESNAWGLYDMHGNVWEWCADWYRDDAAAPETGPIEGALRVVRGGSWMYGPRQLRSAKRHASAPSNRTTGIGFRCARTADAR